MRSTEIYCVKLVGHGDEILKLKFSGRNLIIKEASPGVHGHRKENNQDQLDSVSRLQTCG